MFKYNLSEQEQLERNQSIVELQNLGWQEIEPGIWQNPNTVKANPEVAISLYQELLKTLRKN